jgi:cell division septation protein DedD
MRWLFLVLLVLNAGYVAWELERERPRHVRTTALPTGVERIVLLRELESGTAEKQDIAQQASTPGTLQARIEPSKEDSTQPQQAGGGQPLTTPTQVAVVADVSTDLETVAEAQRSAKTGAPADRPEVMPEAKPAADLCYTLGPFREMKTLRQVTREIKDYVVEASFRSREEQEQTMYRVYVRPVGSKQEARDLTKELVSKNIRDYFIITDGPNKHGISLGYFSDKGRAYRHADHVRELGFDATAEPVFRTYTIYWLDYRIKSGHEIPQQIFDDHLENSAQRLRRTCS